MNMRLNKLNQNKGVEGPLAQGAIAVVLIFTVFLVFVPLVVNFLLSLKNEYEHQLGIWKLPVTPEWSNWWIALKNMSVNMANSVIVSLISAVLVVAIGSISAYVLVRHKFPGKELIFSGIIALMAVPSVLTLTPLYLLALQMGLKNSWLGIILPNTAAGIVGAIFLFRTFLSQQPIELFEAAKIDGAGDLIMYLRIAMPLAIPVLAIQMINSFAGFYNDFLWPTLIIQNDNTQLLMPILKVISKQVSKNLHRPGIESAMYMLSGIPLVFTTAFGLKYFINGEFASGLKM